MDAIKPQLINTLKALCLQPGISTHESTSGIVSLVADRCKQYGADSVEIDEDGNVVATIGDGPLVVLMEAHLDEVGFEVLSVRDDGVALLLSCGIVDGSNLESSEAYLLRTGTKGTLSFDSLEEYILFLPALPNTDIVAGDIISFKRNFISTGEIIRATALDNRIGCAVLLETLRESKAELPEDVQLVLVFSLGEETDKTSVKATIKSYNPDLFIIVDAAYALPVDFEITKPKESIPSLGEGCAIQHKGTGFVVSQERIALLERIAMEQDVKIQHESVEGNKGRTNFPVLLNAGATAGIVINVPVQNQHQDISITHLNDAVSAVKLLASVVGSHEYVKMLFLPEEQISGVFFAEGVL